MKTILLIGATSAVAHAYGRRLAKQGDVRFVLAGRRAEELERIAADLVARGASQARTVPGDLGDPAGVPALVEACLAPFGAPDIALLAYGVLGDQVRQQAEPDALITLMNVNLVSAALWSERLLARFEAEGAGHLALIGSVAGDRGRQSNYLYGATKAGLERIAEGMAHRVARLKGVQVTLVKPGFIDTPMTGHIESKGGPLWASADAIAGVIDRAITRGRTRVYAPWFWRYILLIIRALPVPVMHRTKL